MAWNNSKYPTEGEEGKDLAYDLRQRYAKYVGDHLEYVGIYRKEKNYNKYFYALHDLFVITQHKYKNKSESKKQYKNLVNNLTKVAKQYSLAWFGKEENIEGVDQIENALREIEMFIFEQMDDANIFGGNWEDEGL